MLIQLLAVRRFAPLFATQFLGAFNDNFYKTAMLFLITYKLLAEDVGSAALLVSLAAGIFTLPFFLLSALAGQMADTRDKAFLIRIIKTTEIGIMAFGASALLLGSIPLMLGVLFAMGAQSAVFGPIKYAILPQHLPPRELLAGTGIVEAGTFIAILTGQIAGGLLSTEVAAAGVLVMAVLGLLAGRAVPPAPPSSGAQPVNWNIVTSSLRIIRTITADPQLGRAALAVSWFWAVGVVFTSLFIPLVKGDLAGDEKIATVFLTLFSVGIAMGSLTVAKALKGVVSVRYAPAAAVLMTLFIIDLYFAVHAYPVKSGSALLTVDAFIALPAAWRVMFDLFAMAIAAGAFIVPLYAVLQTVSAPSARAQTIAANNIMNAGAMVTAALVSAALLALGLSVPAILLALGGANLIIILPCLAIRRVEIALKPREVVSDDTAD